MSTGAKITSIDALRSFRVALIKFIEHGNVALMAGDSDVDRTLGWLEREQSVYWAGQLRKRHDLVKQCEQALREKQVFKSFDGTTPSVVDEMKALALAKRRREEAEQKCVAVKKSTSLLRRESLLYKGRMQKLSSTLQGDLPRAVHALGRMLSQLEEYLAVQTTGSGPDLTEALEQFTRTLSTPLVGNARVRSLVPTPAQRQAALPASEITTEPWLAGTLPDWQPPLLHQLLAELPDQPPAPTPALSTDHRITLAGTPWKLTRWALQRNDPAFETDTGWSLYPADLPDSAAIKDDTAIATTAASQPALQTWPIWQLLRARPHVRPLLSLPVGTLVILDEAGIVTILDAHDTDQWAIALSPAPSG